MNGPRLSVRDLRVRSGGRRSRELLRVDHFDLEPGTLVGVRGPSGAGKSTFLHALAGLADHIDGQVNWDGRDIATMSRTERTAFRRAHIGMIFQDFMLFEELSAVANATLPASFAPHADRPERRAQALEVLEQLGLDASPRSVSSMSGGERQRVSVARALAGNARVLLADEPTASLQRDAADALADDIVTQSRAIGRTLIVVSHDEALLDRLDRIVTIRDGLLV